MQRACLSYCQSAAATQALFPLPPAPAGHGQGQHAPGQLVCATHTDAYTKYDWNCFTSGAGVYNGARDFEPQLATSGSVQHCQDMCS